MELSTLARYPFLSETGPFLKDQGITIEDLVSSPAYARAREAGKNRVMEAFVEGKINSGASEGNVEQLIKLLSYIVARMIVSCTADELLVQRYALAEATLVQERLLSEDPDFVGSIASHLGLDTQREGRAGFTVHFSDYLRHSSQMRSEEWKLVNQEMSDGRVLLDRARVARLLQHALQERIASELPLQVNDEIERVFAPAIEAVREEIAKRKARFERESYGRVSFLRLPPCMKEMLAMMKRGENVPHVGRFALTAFMHYIGMSNEEILAAFSTSPDFNEHLARYQIEHITGHSSGIEYLPPECETMKSRGVCFNPDSLCAQKWMTHPLSYYRAKGKRRATAGAKARARSEEPAEPR